MLEIRSEKFLTGFFFSGLSQEVCKPGFPTGRCHYKKKKRLFKQYLPQ